MLKVDKVSNSQSQEHRHCRLLRKTRREVYSFMSKKEIEDKDNKAKRGVRNHLITIRPLKRRALYRQLKALMSFRTTRSAKRAIPTK